MNLDLGIKEVKHGTASTGFMTFHCGCYLYLDRLEGVHGPWTVNYVFVPGICCDEHRRWWAKGRS